MILLVAGLIACAAFVAPRPVPVADHSETALVRIEAGLRFVFSNQLIIGAIALDLFAVLFGGAVALLPVFAKDILNVGPEGLGILRMAMSVGEIVMGLLLLRFPLRQHAGRVLLACVAGFGLCIIGFGLSTYFWLSFFFLFLAGMFDEVSVVLHLDQAQRLVFGGAPPKATSIVVQLRDTRLTEQAQALITARLQDWGGGQPLLVRDFRFLNPFYVQSINMFSTIFSFMFVLIGGIVMFTVSNTMNTTVVERTVEIGTLRAMGLRQAGIRRLFVAEGCALGVAGALIGLAMAMVCTLVVNQLDLHWLPPGSATEVPLSLSLWGEWGLIVGTTTGLIAMATASAWWPAYRAARLNVVEALRHV